MLTIKELAERAPAAMTRTPAGHCSAQYAMIPTVDAVEALSSAGFVLVDAKQTSLAPDRWTGLSHATHMVTLRPKSLPKLTPKQMALGVVPEIHIVNSSDNSHAFELRRGVYRQVCSNGLIAFRSDTAIGAVHRHISASDIIERARRMAAESGALVERIERWAAVKLTDSQASALAAEALALRMGAAAKNYDPASLLVARREEDEGMSLWRVFNRIQENAMTGAIHGNSAETGRAVSARAVKSIEGTLTFNEQLWRLAEEAAAR